MFLRTIPSAVSLLVLAATVVEPVDHRAQAQGPPAPRLDLHGDPLPEGAVARLGTVRLRHGYLLSGLAFSADGKEVFAADYYPGVHVWDAATGAERRRLLRAESYGHGMALSPDGRTLAVALGTLEVKLCDP